MSVTWIDDGAGAAEVHGSAFSGGTAATRVWTVHDGNNVWDRSAGAFVRDATSGSYRSAYPSTATGATTGVNARATKVTGNSTNTPALLNAATPNEAYCVFNRRIYRNDGDDNDAGTIIATHASNPANGSVIDIYRDATTVYVDDDGVAYLSAADTTFTSVIPGIRGLSTTLALDDITLTGDEAAAPSYVIPQGLSRIRSGLGGLGQVGLEGAY